VCDEHEHVHEYEHKCEHEYQHEYQHEYVGWVWILGWSEMRGQLQLWHVSSVSCIFCTFLDFSFLFCVVCVCVLSSHISSLITDHQALYARLFDWLVQRINSSIVVEDADSSPLSIGVLDIYGTIIYNVGFGAW
jgi:hypothetical protein